MTALLNTSNDTLPEMMRLFKIALACAIKDLPRGYRTIFLLHEVEGYEHREIAQMLGCCVGNSKSQLHKAKLRIRERLVRSPKASPQAFGLVDHAPNRQDDYLLSGACPSGGV
jgi:DNA-directed RNA polymerase specialized sigma24 family protein